MNKNFATLRGAKLQRYKKMLVDCRKYITDIDMVVVHNNGQFRMLMPDGKFLEVLIYRRYVRGDFL